jgi:large subunit ribosomal protein L23
MDPYQVIIRSVDTEKTRYQASELGQYTFQVDPGANKIEVKRAVETLFGVKVAGVNMMNVPAKAPARTGRRRVVRVPCWKKAVVTLAEGERIDLSEGA